MKHSPLATALCLASLSFAALGQTPGTLTGDVSQIDAFAGGVQTLSLQAGVGHASEFFFLFGTSSGTTPGLSMGGHTLPLNSDWYLMRSLLAPNAAPLGNSFGVLSAASPGPGGEATSTFTLPTGLGASVLGLTLHHAFVAFDAKGKIVLTSNAVAVNLVGPPAPSGMAQIPAGTFAMGDHQGWGWPDEMPLHPVTLDAFYMDVYETSNEQYRDYLNSAYAQGLITVSGGIVVQTGSGKEFCDTTIISGQSRIVWDGSTFSLPANKLDHPISRVSWHGALAFANWRSLQDGLVPCYDPSTWSCNFSATGYRLPTEAEWEYAARGGHHTPYDTYHWGNSIDGSHASYWQSGNPYETGAYPYSTPRGYYNGAQIPAGVDMVNGYGLYDMSGNMAEWCWDWHDYYSPGPASNPIGPSMGLFRVYRGGSWGSPVEFLRSADRSFYHPDFRLSGVGFRLVRIATP